ncbi:TRAP transporter, DctM subunit [Roseovarius pacificus]|uniref:TRAP transporter large permease protein n=1 Tax=Roseovarius pacificus TaxID=337701 RepID=A0A1M6Y8R3_9RHOB|nr:TRAP transporter large permease subunit [Roseovarius pacificus]GGO51216.1 tripartite transporter large subunit [Roseovarius pacificus]SHL14379.1 TRAP transporter, DctM subunit [Roseovarius pacificus]
MPDPVLTTTLLFAGMGLFLALGVPIAIALGGLSIGMIYLFWSPMALNMVPIKAFSTASSFEYLAIPLFIFMAAMLQRARVADDLYDTMQKFFGGLRGGLAVGTIVICTLFAAMAGISGAATISMGMIAIPSMLSRGYGKDITLGAIAAGGSLGILIPPSVTMIVYGIVANTSIGKLYAGGLMPGLVIAALFCAYLILRGWLQPEISGGQDMQRYSWREKVASLRGLVLPLSLIVAVMGSILSGIASVSEASAVGAGGAILCAVILRRCTWTMLREAAEDTLHLSCMIFWIIIGATAMSTFYTAMGASRLIEGLVLGLEINRWIVLIAMLSILFVMGMLLDTVGIIMITVPIFVPIVVALGFDPVWFGILFIVMMEIGFLTPPFGYNLFYLRGVAPPSIRMTDIYRSVIPFILLMLAAVGLCMAAPGIVLWLPEQLF